MEKIGLIPHSMLVHGALSAVAAALDSSTIEGKGLTMSLHALAKAVSSSTMDKHKAHVRAALEKRKKELQTALAAVERGLAQLGPAAKKSAKRAAKKR
jgi:hypothetical protein